MKKSLTFLVLCITAGCLIEHSQYEYFEPSGLDETVSMPAHDAIKNVARSVWDGSEFRVNSQVEAGRIKVFMRLLLPPGAHIGFSGDRAKLVAAGVENEVQLFWMEWTLENGVGSLKRVPFDALLKPQSFREKPTRKGVEDVGQYEMDMTLPEQFSSVGEFRLILPGPIGISHQLNILFVRKAADYWGTQKIAEVKGPNQSLQPTAPSRLG